MMPFGSNWGMMPGFFGNPMFFWPLIIWSVAWKFAGLWRAGRRGDFGWFIAIFFINLVGILEIVYLFGFGGKGKKIETPTV